MKIDHIKARNILLEEANEAINLKPDESWVNQISELSCKSEKAKTMIAMLGTAILAKATEITVDVFSLKVGDEKDGNTYSARALCKEVLAANSSALGINLGVTGREPLNNQPFFGKDRITREMNVHRSSQKAFDALFEILMRVNDIKTERQARIALRSFICARRTKSTSAFAANIPNSGIAISELIEKVAKYVDNDGEGGKCAQAIVAGILDLSYGNDLVIAKRINDPSRRMAGDIGVLSGRKDGLFQKVFEVRDKPITLGDIDKFIDSCIRHKSFKASVVAVNAKQDPIDRISALRKAENRNIHLRIYLTWDEFIHETLFWSQTSDAASSNALEIITKRLCHYEVSENGLNRWIK